MLDFLKLQNLWSLRNMRVYWVAGFIFCLCAPSFATVTLDMGWSMNSRNITMRVGNAAFGSAPNTVKFDVNNANISPTPSPIPGIPDANSTNSGGIANSVRIYVSNNSAQNRGNNIKVTADSSAGLICVPGSGCGSTVIPFSTVSWTSYQVETGSNAGQDFASGSFTGSATQPLIDFDPPFYCTGVLFFGLCIFGQNRPYSATIFNDQVFTYNNTTLYPAGQYKGTVTYTATLP